MAVPPSERIVRPASGPSVVTAMRASSVVTTAGSMSNTAASASQK